MGKYKYGQADLYAMVIFGDGRWFEYKIVYN